MEAINLTLPYPPSVNSYWRNIGHGRTIVSRAGRNYAIEVQKAVLLAQCRMKATERLSVAIELHQPDKRRRDIDNTAKAILDALGNAGVYLDDSQIDELRIVRGAIRKPGCAEVRIAEIAVESSLGDHTPGPWRTSDIISAYEIKRRKIVASEYSPESGAGICEVYGVEDADNIANAKLIAAAPTMLEALRRIVQRQDVMSGSLARMSTTRRIAAQAIQNATGEAV